MKLSGLIKGGIVATALGGLLALAPRVVADDSSSNGAPAPTQSGPGVAGLEEKLNASGLKFTWNEKHTVARISFSDIKNSDSHVVMAFVPDDKGYYIKLLLTIIDKPEGYHFPPALLKEALAMNDRLWLMRLGLDEKNGDIDAMIGIDQESLTPKVLKDYVFHLINTGDDTAKTLKEFIAD